MIDLCVVTHNSLEHLKRLITKLRWDMPSTCDRPWRLYISDNGSTDGTAEWLTKYGSDWYVDAFFLNENVGYAAACNQLAAVGDSEFLALLNDDVWLSSADVMSMERSFAETGADILGPKQRDEQSRVRHGGIFGTNEAPRFRGWAVKDPNDELFRDRKEAVTVSGSAYFVRRSVWDALTNDPEYRKLVPDATGAFLPTFFYYEETWCSYFARHRGYKLMYDGTVSIGHTWHGSHDKNDDLDKVVVKESRAMFRTACDFMGISRD